ncbi:uncharacterized protein LOC110931754 [Helianthus annuus]|uniref:uncharacterized protein LOC110931754 n=1 Tax=Helianthus annuus TaxID=4232 RepID=UPI000B909343|nr:uncharacterized protein LOC110931754 [Helianthus annuus]
MEVSWSEIVWFASCIPKHAFLLWLVIRKKLLTQDKLLRWEQTRRKSMNMMCCVLCYNNLDSHEHLFFSCKYSSQVWCQVRSHADMSSIQPDWNDIFSDLNQRRNMKLVGNIVACLTVAAATYYIWRERNRRIFQDNARPPDDLAQEILNTVRFKLMGLKFKPSIQVMRMLGKWNICGEGMLDNDDMFGFS